MITNTIAVAISTVLLFMSWSGHALEQHIARALVSPVLEGSWTATAGPTEVFRGTWSGETSPSTPNTVRGSWTLFNEASEIVLQGTWSARKTGNEWQGNWTARTAQGQSLSGSWNADLSEFSGKTMEWMLHRTAEKEVAGSWTSGRRRGDWWLRGSHQRGHK